mmetsp:Transcript_16743/g.20453  ORF Transcript_16743/g.20453 Transcript_16743/m.20453 type:complete len:89 (+) Transcript_16743:130-396(+)
MFIDNHCLAFQKMSLESSLVKEDDKENMSFVPEANLSNITDSRNQDHSKNRYSIVELEPLDYRQDWSREIIDTFKNLRPSIHLEQFVS